ncbi:Non-catalytic module family DOC2, partial [Piromyces sp. E2]
YEDDNGKWGIQGDEWCLILEKSATPEPEECWSEKVGYPCCTKTKEVVFTDKDGDWGLENGDWCGI